MPIKWEKFILSKQWTLKLESQKNQLGLVKPLGLKMKPEVWDIVILLCLS